MQEPRRSRAATRAAPALALTALLLAPATSPAVPSELPCPGLGASPWHECEDWLRPATSPALAYLQVLDAWAAAEAWRVHAYAEHVRSNYSVEAMQRVLVNAWLLSVYLGAVGDYAGRDLPAWLAAQAGGPVAYGGRVAGYAGGYAAEANAFAADLAAWSQAMSRAALDWASEVDESDGRRFPPFPTPRLDRAMGPLPIPELREMVVPPPVPPGPPPPALPRGPAPPAGPEVPVPDFGLDRLAGHSLDAVRAWFYGGASVVASSAQMSVVAVANAGEPNGPVPGCDPWAVQLSHPDGDADDDGIGNRVEYRAGFAGFDPCNDDADDDGIPDARDLLAEAGLVSFRVGIKAVAQAKAHDKDWGAMRWGDPYLAAGARWGRGDTEAFLLDFPQMSMESHRHDGEAVFKFDCGSTGGDCLMAANAASLQFSPDFDTWPARYLRLKLAAWDHDACWDDVFGTPGRMGGSCTTENLDHLTLTPTLLEVAKVAAGPGKWLEKNVDLGGGSITVVFQVNAHACRVKVAEDVQDLLGAVLTKLPAECQVTAG